MNNYEKFFESIVTFKRKQIQQRQRGLNNYNILTSVLKPTDEVRLHSGMIKSLLDIDGDHYQNSLFLELFLSTINDIRFSIDAESCSVYKEYQNIDIYITDGYKHIIIENKINAGDQEGQIKRYIEKIEKENDNLEYEDVLVIYLSTDGRKPSKFSLSNLEINNNYLQRNGKKISLYKSISYKKEMIDWLEKCRFEVQNITNLNEAIKQYVNVVRIINGDYKEKAMSITSYIKNNKSIYKTALEVHKVMPSARRDIVEVFFSNVTDALSTKLGDEWVVEINGSLSTRWGLPFRVCKKSWGGHSLIFGFEFDKKDCYDGYFGIAKTNDLIDIKSDINDKFKEEIKAINLPLNTEAWWLHWEWLPNIDNMSDFSEYIMFEDNAEEIFVERILYFINKFETKSGLLTKINNYLNESA